MALTDKLTAIGNAIRAKTGGSALLTLDQMPTAIANIQTGGNPVVNSLSVTANGTYTAPSGVDGYSPVTVSVPDGKLWSNGTWNEINAVLTKYYNGEIADLHPYFDIGSVRSVTYNGQQHNVIVIGVQHDTIVGSGNKAALSLMFDRNVYNDQMSTDGTCTQYINATLRYTLNNSISQFESNIQSQIKTVIKNSIFYDRDAGTYNSQTSGEKLWVFSQGEVRGQYNNLVSGTYLQDGDQYEYFQNGHTWLFVNSIGSNTASSWSRTSYKYSNKYYFKTFQSDQMG